jgi:hypothetical protein
LIIPINNSAAVYSILYPDFRFQCPTMGFYNPNIIRIPLETFTYKNQSDVVKVSIKNCSDVSRSVSRAGAMYLVKDSIKSRSDVPRSRSKAMNLRSASRDIMM